jgi:hypothetical protein
MVDIHIGTNQSEVKHADGVTVTDDDGVVVVKNLYKEVEIDAAGTIIAPAVEDEGNHGFPGCGIVVYTNDDAVADAGFWVPDTHSNSHDWAAGRYDYGYWLPSTDEVEIR